MKLSYADLLTPIAVDDIDFASQYVDGSECGARLKWLVRELRALACAPSQDVDLAKEAWAYLREPDDGWRNDNLIARMANALYVAPSQDRVTDEMVEKAMTAWWDDEAAITPWAKLPDNVRGSHVLRMRVALEAALSVAPKEPEPQT